MTLCTMEATLSWWDGDLSISSKDGSMDVKELLEAGGVFPTGFVVGPRLSLLQ